MYTINLHSHTDYSDGHNSIYEMAAEAKGLGFSAYVVTDHLYPASPGFGLYYIEEFETQKQECLRVSKELNYPIIQGIEINLGFEEILVFGENVIKEFIDFCTETRENAYITHFHHLEFIFERKEQCAIILCHPELYINKLTQGFYDLLFDTVDAYEKFNRGYDYFDDRDVPKELLNKQGFNNSDAHHRDNLIVGYNTIPQIIINEQELINYIKQRS